jgi:hypothetical protein
MPYVEINGRQMFVPDAGVSGQELINSVNPQKKPGRGTTIIKGPNAERVNPQKTYRASDLVGKNGQPVKWGDMPDRTKGGWLEEIINAIFEKPSSNQLNSYNQPAAARQFTTVTEKKNTSLFWGDRSPLSKRIIVEQCEDIGKHRFGNDVKIDYDGANTFVINNYLLPSAWRNTPGVYNQRTPLAIVFPTEYPKIAPIGFYLKAQIGNAPNGHFYNQAYHDADKVMLDHGWKWYCVYVNAGTWQPAMYRKPNDWRFGDNLWTYFDLITEALTSND